MFIDKVWLPAAANLISSFFFRYAQSLHYIDSNRIAVTGVSYGAYLATLMLADTGDREHPNMLACGVAVSPVVDWRFYGNIQIYYIIYYHILNNKCYIIINLCISFLLYFLRICLYRTLHGSPTSIRKFPRLSKNKFD